MVEQLAIDVEIVECAIVRGEDGLALSSRNELLTPEHRAAAPHIYATISQCAAKMETLSPAELTEWVVSTIDENPLLKTIYFEAVDARTMQRVEKWSDSERIQGCCAVQAGNIRLIDNIRIK
jgi:pantoate--beta-alanine ligase